MEPDAVPGDARVDTPPHEVLNNGLKRRDHATGELPITLSGLDTKWAISG
jgi:hypothetical protein